MDCIAEFFFNNYLFFLLVFFQPLCKWKEKRYFSICERKNLIVVSVHFSSRLLCQRSIQEHMSTWVNVQMVTKFLIYRFVSAVTNFYFQYQNNLKFVWEILWFSFQTLVFIFLLFLTVCYELQITRSSKYKTTVSTPSRAITVFIT